jgi:hypothetical protein
MASLPGCSRRAPADTIRGAVGPERLSFWRTYPNKKPPRHRLVGSRRGHQPAPP